MPPQDVPDGNIWRDNAGRVSAFLSRLDGECRICFPQFASYIFSEAKACQEGIQIVIESGPTSTRGQLVDGLMRNVVPLLLQSRGIQVFHASAIRLGDGIVGLCGSSFAGKSTLAYALQLRGYEVWADDALLISATNQDVRVLKDPLVKLRLRPEARKYFSVIESGSSNEIRNIDAEFELSLSDMKELPLKALCLLNRGSKEQAAEWCCNKINGHEALIQILSLANYYDLTDIDEHRRITESCLKVVSSAPIYKCHYRGGFEFIEAVVDEIEHSFSLGR